MAQVAQAEQGKMRTISDSKTTRFVSKLSKLSKPSKKHILQMNFFLEAVPCANQNP